jgi:hypothetical protein
MLCGEAALILRRPNPNKKNGVNIKELKSVLETIPK